MIWDLVLLLINSLVLTYVNYATNSDTVNMLILAYTCLHWFFN